MRSSFRFLLASLATVLALIAGTAQAGERYLSTDLALAARQEVEA
jgi:hypothetical protein